MAENSIAMLKDPRPSYGHRRRAAYRRSAGTAEWPLEILPDFDKPIPRVSPYNAVYVQTKISLEGIDGIFSCGTENSVHRDGRDCRIILRNITQVLLKYPHIFAALTTADQITGIGHDTGQDIPPRLPARQGL